MTTMAERWLAEGIEKRTSRVSLRSSLQCMLDVSAGALNGASKGVV